MENTVKIYIFTHILAIFSLYSPKFRKLWNYHKQPRKKVAATFNFI